MDDIDYEKVPGTWAHTLREHFEAFNTGCWKAFNIACKDMNEKGHENKVDYFKWREYVLWDMKKKHEKEVNEK